MEDCWRLTVNDRPTFAKLRQRLDAKITKESADAYMTLDAPYVKFNQQYQNLVEDIADAEVTLPKNDEEEEGGGETEEDLGGGGEEKKEEEEGSAPDEDEAANERAELSERELCCSTSIR